MILQDQKDQIISLLKEGNNYKKISEILELSYNSVKYHCGKSGFKFYEVIKYFRKKINCKFCKKEIEVSGADKRMFCGHVCAATYTSKNRDYSYKNDKRFKMVHCQLCNKELSVHIRSKNSSTCCQECKPRPVVKTQFITSLFEPKIDLECRFCKKRINSKNKYCSLSCQKSYRKSILYNIIESGDGSIFQRPVYRTYLIDKYEAKCSRCGWREINPKTKRCPIEIHHLDGDPENNKVSNMILLCPNCHSLTGSYKGANRGKGRKHRRKNS